MPLPANCEARALRERGRGGEEGRAAYVADGRASLRGRREAVPVRRGVLTAAGSSRRTSPRRGVPSDANRAANTRDESRACDREPDPVPLLRVVKKGSKMCGRWPRPIPRPNPHAGKRAPPAGLLPGRDRRRSPQTSRGGRRAIAVRTRFTDRPAGSAGLAHDHARVAASKTRSKAWAQRLRGGEAVRSRPVAAKARERRRL